MKEETTSWIQEGDLRVSRLMLYYGGVGYKGGDQELDSRGGDLRVSRLMLYYGGVGYKRGDQELDARGDLVISQ